MHAQLHVVLLDVVDVETWSIDMYMLHTCFNLLNVATHIQTQAEISG